MKSRSSDGLAARGRVNKDAKIYVGRSTVIVWKRRLRISSECAQSFVLCSYTMHELNNQYISIG